MTTEIIRYHVAPDQAEAFAAAYHAAGAILDRSPDCHGYEILRGVEEPNRFLVIIRWTSVERHLEGFRKGPDFPPFFALVKPFFSAIEEMKHYEA
ncbi:antibiotic biosynthesis monooxygenase [bacterium]|nr:MAG: antibiotic biosynthesis monooxygenase [bacterium]